MIHVPDVRATVAWYENIGFTIKATYADETGDNFSFAIMSFGEATEVMFSTDGETSNTRRREVDLYVYTDNVDELYERLKDSVDVVEKPHDTFYGMHELIIRDLNRFWITFGEESVFAILMGGVYEADEERVKRAVESGRVDRETLNVALAFATSKENEAIVRLLTDAGAQPPPHVDLQTLESYAGLYKGEQGISAEITVKDGRLFATPAGEQPMSLWPLDQVTFRPVAMAGAKLVFNVENDQVKGLSLIHDGHRIDLIRISANKINGSLRK
jgi:hypothetical protein